MSPHRQGSTVFVRASVALHVVALGVLAVHAAWWPWALAALVGNHALITAIGLWPRSTWLGRNWRRLPECSVASRAIALTIDDGPDPEVTPKVLEILARHGAVASFFCIARRAEQHPELCREIVRRGHAIENHSDRHRHDFSLLGPGGYLREIAAAQERLVAASGVAPRFFRAPAGLRNPFLEPVLARLGLTLASWTRRGFDTRCGDPDTVVRRLLRDLRAGDILLLHDGHAARTPSGRPVILEALPRVLEAIQRAGLKTVTLRSTLDPSQP